MRAYRLEETSQGLYLVASSTVPFTLAACVESWGGGGCCCLTMGATMSLSAKKVLRWESSDFSEYFLCGGVQRCTST